MFPSWPWSAVCAWFGLLSCQLDPFCNVKFWRVSEVAELSSGFAKDSASTWSCPPDSLGPYTHSLIPWAIALNQEKRPDASYWTLLTPRSDMRSQSVKIYVSTWILICKCSIPASRVCSGSNRESLAKGDRSSNEVRRLRNIHVPKQRSGLTSMSSRKA